MILQALSNLLSSNPVDGYSTDSNASWSSRESIASIGRPVDGSLVFVEAHSRTHNEAPLESEWMHAWRRNNKSNNSYFSEYTEQVSFLERTLSEIYVMAMKSNKTTV